MAHNCLAEEARESIFTHPGGVAVARRWGGGGGGGGAGVFVLISYSTGGRQLKKNKKFVTRTLGGGT